MGRRGPQKAPSEIKIAHGTFRKDRDGAPSELPQPQVLNDSPTPPELGEYGAAKWVEMFERLSRLGVITETDLDALEVYCRSFDEVAKLDATLAVTGLSYVSEKGAIHLYPEATERRWWLEQRRRYGSEFGLTPSARTAVRVNPSKGKPPVARRERGA